MEKTKKARQTISELAFEFEISEESAEELLEKVMAKQVDGEVYLPSEEEWKELIRDAKGFE